MVLIAERTSRRAVLVLSLASLAVTISLVPLVSGPSIYALITFGALMLLVIQYLKDKKAKAA